MINSELKNYGTGMCTFHRQPPVTTKKVVLADVQNGNRSLIRNPRESLPFVEGRSIADAIKICGTKRLTPECPSDHTFPLPSSKNVTAEHLMYTRKKIEYVPEKRFQDDTNKFVCDPQLSHFHNMQQDIPQQQPQMRDRNIHFVPVVAANYMDPKMSYASPSLPSSFGKPGNGMQAAECDFTSGVPHFANSKRGDDRQWEEHYINLQKFLKKCDESNRGDQIQMLLQLSPAELSKHAVELEKRAIQLTIEEAKEMQRANALIDLGKSAASMNPLQTSKPPQIKK